MSSLKHTTLTPLENVNFHNTKFGLMVANGFDWNNDQKGADYTFKWENLITGLSPKTIEFYKDKINNRIVLNCFNLYPANDDLEEWKMLLINEVTKAIEDQAPTLEMLAYPSIMEDGTIGEKGVMNLQEDGTDGHRQIIYNSEYPQAMLDNNIQEYGSTASSESKKETKYKSSLDAIKDLNDSRNEYIEVINRIIDAIFKSGVFSVYIY